MGRHNDLHFILQTDEPRHDKEEEKRRKGTREGGREGGREGKRKGGDDKHSPHTTGPTSSVESFGVACLLLERRTRFLRSLGPHLREGGRGGGRERGEREGRREHVLESVLQ